jgi:hypothetical protein
LRNSGIGNFQIPKSLNPSIHSEEKGGEENSKVRDGLSKPLTPKEVLK